MFVSLQGFRNQKIGCLREATYMATFKCKRKVKTIQKGGTRMGLPSMAAVAYLCVQGPEAEMQHHCSCISRGF